MNTSESHISALTPPSAHTSPAAASRTTSDTSRTCPTEAMLDTMARGWCPGLARPMASGDGLLARVHPPHGSLTPEQALALAEAAHQEGNGLIDITSHANLQIRGVKPATHAALRARLAPLGLDDAGRRAPYRATVLSPLAGLDGNEQVDGLELAEQVEAIARAVMLPPKFLIAVESGGSFPLTHLNPDLRLAATAPGHLHLRLAGRPALSTAPLPVAQVLAALPLLLEKLATTLAQAGVRRVRMLTGNARRAVLVQSGLTDTASPENARAVQHEQAALASGSHLADQTFSVRPEQGAAGNQLNAEQPVSNPQTGVPEIRAASVPSAAQAAQPHVMPAERPSLPTRMAGEILNPHEPGGQTGTYGEAQRAPRPEPATRSGFRAIEDAVPAHVFPEDQVPSLSCVPLSAPSGLPPHDAMATAARPQPIAPRAGTMRLRDGTFALFAAPPFGQMSARALEGVARLAQDLGLPEIRLSPLRGIVLAGIAPATLAEARTRLDTLGLIIRADDSRLRILTCAGAPACSRALCNSHSLASQLATHLRPATGTEDIHLSACLKGCARRGAAPLTLVAQSGGFDVIPDGGPLDTPALVLTFPEILHRLSTLPAGRALREAFVKDHSAR